VKDIYSVLVEVIGIPADNDNDALELVTKAFAQKKIHENCVRIGDVIRKGAVDELVFVSLFEAYWNTIT